MPRTEGAINKPVGYARYTALSSAIDLIGNPAPNTNPNNHVGDAGTMSAPVRALIQCDTQDARWTDDGTTPTSTGHAPAEGHYPRVRGGPREAQVHRSGSLCFL